MTQDILALRRERYFELSPQIAQLDHEQLHSLLENSESNQSSTGWGTNHTLEFGGIKLFIKRVPATSLEYDNLFSTRNLYSLPTSCHYGFRSPGPGVFRELMTQIRTTQWVLAGEIATFPLMYHYRIVPHSERQANEDPQQWQHPNIQKYATDRATAPHELVLFLEYIPHVLETWLHLHPDRFQQSFDDLCKTIRFLRTKGMIHFDAHLRNCLTDGEQTYLTDFGLALDRSFQLSNEEAAFFEQHTCYDYGELLRNLGHLVRAPYLSCSEAKQHQIREKYGIPADAKLYEVGAVLLDRIEQIQADQDLNLDRFYVATVVKYRSIIALMQNFFTEMWGNDRKDTPFPAAELKQLLKQTGLLDAAE